jgi:superfamily II DNA or RNA helicase
VLVNAELRTGIDQGILAPYHYFGAFDDVDYSRIRQNGVSYNIRDLERALVIPARDLAIIKKWREHADSKPTIAFCCSHRHAERVAMSFCEQGINAEAYLSTTSIAKRKEITARLDHGITKILCVVDVINEGADFPFVECLLFLRPTDSKRIFFQQLGRGLRKYVGKSHCIVIDFIGNFRNAHRIVEYHGLNPEATEQPTTITTRAGTAKELLNLPLGCEVHFDEKVIDIFASQAFDPRYATRHNIARILIYQYDRLARQLGRKPTRRDIDRNCILPSEFYSHVFGAWNKFQKIVAVDD